MAFSVIQPRSNYYDIRSDHYIPMVRSECFSRLMLLYSPHCSALCPQGSSPGWSRWPRPAPSWSAATSLERPSSRRWTSERSGAPEGLPCWPQRPLVAIGGSYSPALPVEAACPNALLHLVEDQDWLEWLWFEQRVQSLSLICLSTLLSFFIRAEVRHALVGWWTGDKNVKHISTWCFDEPK